MADPLFLVGVWKQPCWGGGDQLRTCLSFEKYEVKTKAMGPLVDVHAGSTPSPSPHPPPGSVNDMFPCM